MIEDQKIKQRLEQAFAPHRCEVIIDPYKPQLSFKIFGEDDKVITKKENMSPHQFYDEKMLESYIRVLRNYIEEKGHKLNPWP
jgi:stress-induced morphogen